MLRELLTGLVVVFMASSVIISSVFRSTRSDKHQLPVKNINGSASITDKREIRYKNLVPTSPTLSPKMFKSQPVVFETRMTMFVGLATIRKPNSLFFEIKFVTFALVFC